MSAKKPPTISIPVGLTLDLDVPKLVAAVGRRAAKVVRARMAEGKGAGGRIPMPSDRDNVGLRRSGQLMDSVAFRRSRKNKETGVVFPTGSRSDKSPTAEKRNAGLLSILLATRPEIAESDPMGVDDALRETMADEVPVAMAKQRARLKARRSKTVR